MTSLIAAAVVLTVLGIAFAAGLSVAARYFRVETDPRLQAVLDALPGINCGACGYPGCAAYAGAVAGGAEVDLCVPGGPGTARRVAEIMGVKLDTERRPVRSVVRCQGGCDDAPSRYQYDGIADCRAANALQGGPKGCEYGCLGFGNCARACPFGAITMSPQALPRVDRAKCTGCGTCVRACPRSLMQTPAIDATIVLACSNRGPAKEARQACRYGCIKCRKCVRASAEGAVEMVDNLPKLRYAPGDDYAPALAACPQHCFVTVRPRGFERSA